MNESTKTGTRMQKNDLPYETYFLLCFKSFKPFHYKSLLCGNITGKRKCKDCSSILFNIMYNILRKCKQKIDVTVSVRKIRTS